MLLLDAGVWVAAKDDGDRFMASARELVLNTGRAAAALDLTYYEVANVIGAVWRQPEMAARVCRTLPVRCERIESVESNLLESSIALIADQGLSAYDAAYVAVAQRYGWTLVSTDIRDLVSKGLAVTPDDAV